MKLAPKLDKYTTLNFYCCCAMLLNISSLSAQDSNGSVPKYDYFNLLADNSAEESMIQVDTLDPILNVTLTIQVFVVNSEDGEAHFSSGSLNSGISKANNFFGNIGIRFQPSEIQIVPEYEYAQILYRDSIYEMEVKYAREDYINLFLVDTVLPEGLSCFGYTTYPNDTLHSSIFLDKELASGKYLTALLGNFFGLLRTHEMAGGSESVDGLNCASAGDYICDTYADPGLAGLVDGDCLFLGEIKDIQGEYYVPSVANLMSDSPDFCKCIFTMEQYRRMKYYYINYRSNLR